MSFIVSPAFIPLVLRRATVPLLFFLLLFTLPPLAQAAPAGNSEIARIMSERRAVEQNLAGLKQQLKEYQSKLNTTKKQESLSLKALENIRTQIALLEKMIRENQNYLEKLDRDIDRLKSELQGNRQHYGQVSDDFSRTAVSVYKYGENRDIEHLFSAGSLSDALVRAQYMGFFTRAVRRNVVQLQDAAAQLEKSRLALEASYRRKAEVVKEQEHELKSWAASKKEKEVMLGRLQKNKQEYAAQLQEVQKKRQQLQSRIESLIFAEQRAIAAEKERQKRLLEAKRLEARRLEAKRLEAERLEAKRAEAERKELQRRSRKEKTVGTPALSSTKKEKQKPEPRAVPPVEKPSVTAAADNAADELDRISADFDHAFGSLPWPVHNGVISQRFGSQEDKDLKIVTTNNGIDISVPQNTQVRAVSGGKVAQIAFVPTFGNIVIIRHPNSYLTVYANLGQLHVAKNDLIKSQQLVGMSGRTESGRSVVHFEIWKGRVKQNPENWLKR